jgi:hypothetical protein
MQAAVLALPRRQAEVRRIAELPALERQQRAAREHRAVRGQPGRAAAQETALALAQATLAPVTRSAQQISPRPRRIERSRSSWLLLAFVLGLFVLVAGVMLTVLILAGAV